MGLHANRIRNKMKANWRTTPPPPVTTLGPPPVKHKNDLLPFGLPLEVATYVASFSKLGEQVKLRRVCYSFKCFVDVEIAEQHVEYFAAHVSVQDDCSGDIAVSTTNYHSPWFPSERIFCSFLRMVDPFGDLGSYLLHCLLMMRPLQPLVLWSRCSAMCHFLESACQQSAIEDEETEIHVVTMEDLVAVKIDGKKPLQSWQKLALSHVCGRHMIFSHPVESRFYDTNVTLVDMVKILLKHYHLFSIEDFRPFILKSEKLQSELDANFVVDAAKSDEANRLYWSVPGFLKDINWVAAKHNVLSTNLSAHSARKKFFVVPSIESDIPSWDIDGRQEADEWHRILSEAISEETLWVPKNFVRNNDLGVIYSSGLHGQQDYQLVTVLNCLVEMMIVCSTQPNLPLSKREKKFLTQSSPMHDSIATYAQMQPYHAKKLQFVSVPNLEILQTSAFQKYSVLQVVELSYLPNLKTISECFCEYSTTLQACRLTSLPSLLEIEANFLFRCKALQYVEFSDLPLLRTIGVSFLHHCEKLERVNCVTSLPDVQTVGAFCCCGCKELKVFPMSAFGKNSQVFQSSGFLQGANNVYPV